MAYTKYSLTPANNNAAPPDGAPEGMLPSAVNDTMRDMMAQIRDVGDGIRGGTYTMTAPVITGGSITGSTINNAVIGGTTRAAGSFTTITGTNDASISGLTVGKGASSGGSGGGSTALGVNALANANGSSFNNTAVGSSALNALTSASSNVALGLNSLLLTTTGSNNTALGTQALNFNTTGTGNTGVGFQTLSSSTTASSNTAVGYQAGFSNTTGADCVFVGHSAGYGSTGNNNLAVGKSALSGAAAGNNNQCFGSNAGLSLTSGNGNLLLGMAAGRNLTSGNANTFVGPNWNNDGAGALMTTGANNTILGPYTGNNDGYDMRTLSNRVVIADGSGLRQLTMFNGGTVALAGAIPQSGTGITFPATQSASSDANTLDDYEEGTWTPTLRNATTTTYTTQNARYVKIGRVVYIQLNLRINSVGNGNTSQIAGLPFAASGETNNEAGIGIANLDASATNVVSIYAGVFSTFINITSLTSASATFPGNPIFKNATIIELGGWYLAAT